MMFLSYLKTPSVTIQLVLQLELTSSVEHLKTPSVTIQWS